MDSNFQVGIKEDKYGFLIKVTHNERQGKALRLNTLEELKQLKAELEGFITNKKLEPLFNDKEE